MKIKNSHLLIVFLVLLIGVAGFQFMNRKKAHGNLRNSFYDFDTSVIKSFQTYKLSDKSSSLKIIKEKNIWFVEVNSVYRFEVSQEYINKAISEFSKLKPSRLVTNDKTKWKDYGVDSNGTLLIVETKNKNRLEIIIGNLGFQNEKYINTFVRIPDENEVYASECYMEGTFKGNADQWRKKEVLSTPATNATYINYSKNQTGYVLENKNGQWFIQNEAVDTSSVNILIQNLDKLNRLGFAAYDIIPFLKAPEFNIKLGFEKSKITNLSFYHYNNKHFLLSDHNKGNFMEIDSTLEESLVEMLKSFE